MRFRLNSLVLILGTLVPILGTAQEQVMRFRPPFAGLVQNLNQTDIPDNAFFILSNAGLTSSGEIYKRGALVAVHSITGATTNALKVDSNNNSIGIGSMYRYYRSNGAKRLLATTIGKNFVDSTQFGHWYWLNDTTGRFGYTYTNSPDTMSQVEYHKLGGKVVVRQNATHRAEYLIDPKATFFLNCGNLSDIKWRYKSTVTADDYGFFACGVYVVNDTILAFERDSLQALSGPDTLVTGREYEVHYRTAATQSSTPVLFQASATTYLDSVIFSRSTFDPIGWDGTRTFRANVLDQGMFTSTPGSVTLRPRDSTKVWTTNQWSGMWLFDRRTSNMKGATPAGEHLRWQSNWYPILRNGTDTLFLDSIVNNAGVDDTAAYAIVSMPIDEVIFERQVKVNSAPGNETIIFDTSYFSYRTQKMIYASPLQVLITKGSGAGRRYQVVMVSDDTLYIGTQLEHPIDSISGRIALIRSRFPSTKFIEKYKERTLWISDTIYQNSIYPSVAGRSGYVEPNTQIVVNPNDGEFIQSAWMDGDRLVCGKSTKLYEVANRSVETSGDSPDIWQVNLLTSTIGCESPKSVVQRDMNTWFFDWPQGFYRMSGNQIEKISENIRPMIDSICPSARDKIWGVYYPSKKGDLILWGIPLIGAADSLKPNRTISYSPATGAWATCNITNTDAVRPAIGLVTEGIGDAGDMYLGLTDSAYLLRYFPDQSTDTLDGQGTPTAATTFSLVAESKRFELPGQQIRFSEMEPILNNSGTSTVAFDFYKNLSTSSVAQLSLSIASGWQNFRKSLSDAVIGNQLAWRITTSSAQSFRLGGLDITVLPAGRRLPE